MPSSTLPALIVQYEDDVNMTMHIQLTKSIRLYALLSRFCRKGDVFNTTQRANMPVMFGPQRHSALLIGVNSLPHTQAMGYHAKKSSAHRHIKVSMQQVPLQKASPDQSYLRTPRLLRTATAAESLFPTVINQPYETLFQGSLKLELRERVLMAFLSHYSDVSICHDRPKLLISQCKWGPPTFTQQLWVHSS